MVRYPHKLYVVSSGTPEVDESGNIIQPALTEILKGDCQAVINSGGRKIGDEDGRHIVYSAEIYLPSSTGAVVPGARVKVKNDSNEILSGNVLRYHKYQTHVKIWV